MRSISWRYCLFLERLLLDFCGKKNEWHCGPLTILQLARAIPRAATWLRINQDSCGHYAQSDWPLFDGSCVLNLIIIHWCHQLDFDWL